MSSLERGLYSSKPRLHFQEWVWFIVVCGCSFKGKREKKKKDDDDEEEDVKRQQVPRMYLTFKGR